MSTEISDKARQIRLLIVDIDGVLTDGGLHFDNQGQEYKTFNSLDGHGIRMLLDSERTYSESEINDLLQEWSRDVAPAIQVDHVTLRRHLVDYGHLERTADGARDRIGYSHEAVAFDLDVEDVDVRATIAAFRNRDAPPP